MKRKTVDEKDTAQASTFPPARPAPRDDVSPLSEFLGLPLGAFLDRLAEQEPVPGGGSAAAVATSMAAALVAMTARASREVWPDARAVAAQAESLRSRAEPLAQADAQAYEEVLRLLAEPPGEDPQRRDAVLGAAFSQAATLPLRIAEAACDVADLAALAAERADPKVRPDAVAAVVLADCAARIGAHLVHVNLATQPGDKRVARVDALVETTSAMVRRVLR